MANRCTQIEINLGQPSATHPHFWQTCLFTNFPNILTTIRGSEFKEIREKAGLSKMGMSCRRLIWAMIHWKVLPSKIRISSFVPPSQLCGKQPFRDLPMPDCESPSKTIARCSVAWVSMQCHCQGFDHYPSKTDYIRQTFTTECAWTDWVSVNARWADLW